MKRAIAFEAKREGYAIDQLRNPITVKELIEVLENFDEDAIVVLSHDRGYTYGSIDPDDVTEWVGEEDEDGEIEWSEERY